MKTHESFLRKRENGKMDKKGWYGYVYPKNLDKQEVNKLIVAQTVPSLRVCFDHNAAFYLNNVRVNGILPNGDKELGWYLLGVLNAPVADFIFKRIAKVKEGGYYEANKQFIAPLPIPDATPEQKQQVAQLAEKLQELHTTHRDELAKLEKRLKASQMQDNLKTPQWIWAKLPDEKQLKISNAAIATGLKGKALTEWAKNQYQQKLDEKLSVLAARLHPQLKLSVRQEDGELTLLADGIIAFDSVYLDEDEAIFIAAQWRYFIRSTNITPSLSAEKVLSELLKLKSTENTSLRKQIIDLDKKLDELEHQIKLNEQAINNIVYSLYELTKEEIMQIEQG
ncbi:TaqI-like C-terminal specificity domain-containing protein [Thiofilum flexile]|uniref:TaqI-like C-terminal specificity domain-containing protein n=1 Tax=Thiofilum flexile TaxID=125627 RepID=UPI0003AA6289|nr:TaqI-like C-terminal specificity domain-containing protein [Thiofilum flexile]